MEKTKQVIKEMPENYKKLRVKPSVGIGIAILLVYLVIFYTTWAINNVDYETMANTVESAKLTYAFPTLFGSLFLVVAVTFLGWWKPVLFDKVKSGPRWAWIAPITMFVIALLALTGTQAENASTMLIIWIILGGLGVGIGEEIATRGTLIVGLRSKLNEGKVWLYSTLIFMALHIPNVFFGLPPSGVLPQLVLTFIAGSMLYATRRVTGTLLIPILLHGLWDTSIFLPRATGYEGPLAAASFLLYPIAIIVSIVVVRHNWNIRAS